MMFILIPASDKVSYKGNIKPSTRKHHVESVICQNVQTAAVIASTTPEKILEAYHSGNPFKGWFVDRWDRSWEAK